MSVKLPIYLDNMATTPVDDKVVEVMTACLGREGNFGNPASTSHSYGWRAKEAVALAREQVARAIGASPNEIIFTSGATESNNLAILGVANFYARKGKHIVSVQTEHKAVLDVLQHLQSQGYEITIIKPSANGLVTPEMLESALRADTILVSVMHVNNEIGVIQDIAALSRITREKGILFHTDAAQSVAKVPVDVEALGVDLLSVSAHKAYGPKGVGALYVRHKPRVRLAPLIFGGGHEHGLRSGTLATHQIMGMGAAFEIAVRALEQETARIMRLRDKLWQGIQQLDQVFLHGSLEHRVAHNLNVGFAYVEGEALMMALKDLAISAGSACTSATIEPSHVLLALGLKDTIAHSSLRFSLGRYTTEAEIDYAIAHIVKGVTWLREMSPLWEEYQRGGK